MRRKTIDEKNHLPFINRPLEFVSRTRWAIFQRQAEHFAPLLVRTLAFFCGEHFDDLAVCEAVLKACEDFSTESYSCMRLRKKKESERDGDGAKSEYSTFCH